MGIEWNLVIDASAGWQHDASLWNVEMPLSDKRWYSIDIDIECSNIILPLRKAIHLGVLINELLTNSHKYARSDEDILRLKIRLYESENEHVLEYSDNGPGLTKGLESEKKGSIGMYVLKSMTRQLRGKLTYETNSGASFVLRFKK